MAFNRIVKEAKCVMIYEQEIPSELLELYNHMIDIAIKQNAFFENRSGFYNYEKMYLQSEGLLFCWQKFLQKIHSICLTFVQELIIIL